MKNSAKRILLPVLLIIATLITEIFFAALPFFTCVSGNNSTVGFPAGYPKLIDSDDCQLTLDFNNTPVYGISFLSESAEEEPFFCNVSVFFKPEGSGDYEYSKTHRFFVTGDEKETVFYDKRTDNISSVVLSFDCEGHEAIVGNFTVNPEFSLSFSPVRFAVIAIAAELIYLCIACRKKVTSFLTFRRVGIVSVIICLAMSILMSYCTYDKSENGYTEYPLRYDVKYYDPYVQQFDAFHKGQLNIDTVPDENFAGLENPYDPDQREGTDYLWDRAFYNGKYYSYFGIAPIVLVYEPWYLITGSLPTGSTVLSVFSLIASVFLPLAVVELTKKFGKGCSPVVTLLLAVGTTFSSMIYLIQRGVSQFYYIATAGGIAFTGVFAYLILKAFNARNKKAKYPLFVLAGIAFGIIFHCRINSALIPAVFALVAVISYLVKSVKEKAVPQYAAHMLCLGAPVVLAVCVSFIYNYIRFGSPLEFGTTYQITVADVSTYAIDYKGFIPSVYHYFIQKFRILNEFPFLSLQGRALDNIETCQYIDQGLGAFMYPLNILICATPLAVLMKKKKHTEDFLMISGLTGVLAVAFTDYCLGGVIFRYTGDIAVSCALIASLALICIYSRSRKTGTRIATEAITAVFTTGSVICGFMAAFSFSGNLMDYPTGIFSVLSNIFTNI